MTERFTEAARFIWAWQSCYTCAFLHTAFLEKDGAARDMEVAFSNCGFTERVPACLLVLR